MQIVVIGVNHTRAPLHLRERLSIAADALAPALERLRAVVSEGFILSTCNRTELYGVCGHQGSGAETLRRALAEEAALPMEEVRAMTYAHAHDAAVRHAFRVASGLDSLVLGEDQILAQIKRAMEAARAHGALGASLDRMWSAALACGKRVRTETGVGRHAVSVVSIGLCAAARARGALDGSRVLLLGAGDTAELVLKHLSSVRGARVAITNRTAERAERLAGAYGARVVPWEARGAALAESDIVFGCTSAAVPVLDAATIGAAVREPGSAPLVLVDLGVPRDIDPAAGALDGTVLVDVDQLEREAAAHRDARQREVAGAEAIIGEELERYMEWWRGRGVAGAIARLHEHAETIREAELERALARMPELSPQGQAIVRAMATRIVGKLLHQPTVALKRDAEGANMAIVLERLFALGPHATAAGGGLPTPAFAGEPTHLTKESIPS